MASSPVSIGEDDESLMGGGGGGGARKRGKVRKESEHKRRLMMNQYFDELVILLSMVTETVSSRKMDKVTTLHEAVSLFKLYYDLDQSQGPVSKTDLHQTYRPEYLQFGEAASFLLDSLGAFLIVLSETGRILYSTDLITSVTGYLPCRVVGQTIYDCLHVDDHFVIKDLYRVSSEEGGIWSRKDSPIICYPPKSLRCRFKIFSNDSSMSGCSRSFSCLSYLRQWKEAPADNTRSPMGNYKHAFSFLFSKICVNWPCIKYINHLKSLFVDISLDAMRVLIAFMYIYMCVVCDACTCKLMLTKVTFLLIVQFMLQLKIKC